LHIQFLLNLKAPIALFVYNRLQHTIKTVEAIRQAIGANESDLFIFCDGAKEKDNVFLQNEITEVRAFVKSIKGFKTVQIVEQKSNLGLSKSIISGVSHLLENNNAIIILEDDIVVGKDFLNFMNNALLKYENEAQIAGISGYSFPINEKQPYFSRTGSCWGWATYKIVWDDFIKKRDQLNLDLIAPQEKSLFNVYGNVYSEMFLQTKQGIIQSWAVEFYLYYFSQKQFFLMPGVNLIANEGFDGSGAHSKKGNFLTDHNPIRSLPESTFPPQIQEEKHIRGKIEKLYRQGYAKPSMINSFVNKIKSVLLGNENNHH
jgi:hypothetical protein